MCKFSSFRLIAFLFIPFLAINPACHKDPGIWDPQVQLIIKPDSGLTTQTFDFIIDIPNLPDNQKDFFIRWDMNADSIWDASFTSSPTITQRFYQKGIHTVMFEILTKDGQTVTISKTIRVDQGYSAPHVAFSIDPSESNYLTEFTFNADSTIDDEDPLSSLQFRWDFEDDGKWDTEFSTNPKAKFKYAKSGNYNVKLIVMDPTHRVAAESKILIVNLTDTLIQPDFTWSSKDGTVKDTFLLDASATHHLQDTSRVFTFTWNIKSEIVYGPFTAPEFLHVFWEPGMEQITLTAKDQFGLSNSITKEFFVMKENKPPIPNFLISNKYGNITTIFFLSAWLSRDDATPPSRLLIRWDFEGDGNWDTGWSYDKTLFHQFSEPGNYFITLEAQDEGGERTVTKSKVTVSKYKSETGFIEDRRDGKYYGTVKIGNQWWMSDNLDYRTNPKMDIPMLQKCYKLDEKMCDLYGSLYQGERAANYAGAGKNICPDGWRVPTREDWLLLGKQIPATDGRDALLMGGILGFNGRYTGYGSFYFIYDPSGAILGTQYNFMALHEEAKYLSLTTRPYVFETQSQFHMGLQNDFTGVDLLWGDLNGYYSVRCIKSE